MMREIHRPVALVTLMFALGGLVGCDAATTASPGGAAPTATARPFVPPTLNGRWEYRDATTIETLTLRERRGGVVGGDGSAADKGNGGKVGHSSIVIQQGHHKGAHLTLSLYVTQVDWGSGLTIVENLSCAVSARRLRCLMDAPLFANVHNVKQEFVRRS